MSQVMVSYRRVRAPKTVTSLLCPIANAATEMPCSPTGWTGSCFEVPRRLARPCDFMPVLSVPLRVALF